MVETIIMVRVIKHHNLYIDSFEWRLSAKSRHSEKASKSSHAVDYVPAAPFKQCYFVDS